MNKIIGTKVISFDADGILWHLEKVTRHSLFHVLVELKKLDPKAVDMLNVDARTITRYLLYLNCLKFFEQVR